MWNRKINLKILRPKDLRLFYFLFFIFEEARDSEMRKQEMRDRSAGRGDGYFEDD